MTRRRRLQTLFVGAAIAILASVPTESGAQGTVVQVGLSCVIDPAPLIEDAVAVSANDSPFGDDRFAIALRADGTLAVWGPDEDMIDGVHSDVCAGELFGGDADAQAACPAVCDAHTGLFNGNWTNEAANAAAAGCVAGQEAVCGCQPKDVVAISAGVHDALALRADGTIFRWGECPVQAFGQCSFYTPMPAGLSDVIAIDNDRTSIALKSDGTVVTWGYDSFPTETCWPKPRWPGSTCLSPPPGLDGVVSIAAGLRTLAAVKSDGTVVVWGAGFPSTSSPEMPAALNRDIVKVELGTAWNFALKSDGTVFTWGYLGVGSPPAPVPAGLTGVVDIEFYGDTGGQALKADGTVERWGPTPHSICPGDNAIHQDFCAGQLFGGNADAEAECPAVCDAHTRGFNGSWTNEASNAAAAGCVAGQEAVCGCSLIDVTAMDAPSGIEPVLFLVERDSDGDGVPDNRDAFPDDPNESADTDGDSVGDNGDNCPDTHNPDQADLDGDAAGNVCDDEDAQFELDRATVWRTRSKLGRIILEGRIPSGVHGVADLFTTDAGFSVQVTDGLDLDKTVVFDASDCETLSPRLKRCRLPDKKSWVKLNPVEGTPDDHDFKADLRRLDIGSPQLGPVDVTIRHGDIDRVGSNETCRVYTGKLVCRD